MTPEKIYPDPMACDPATPEQDAAYMRRALALAEEAAEADEVPVGALIVKDGKIIAVAHNSRESDKCATRHAELVAIERACQALGGWRLVGCTLYVTLEPCPMCAGAAVNARLPRVVYGAPDEKAGAFGSRLDLNACALNHRPRVEGGILAEEASAQLSAYFRRKRKKPSRAPE